MLLGVFAGIFIGLFFGEDAAWMSIPGDIFIGLLQMTVLPYIMFTLIVNIGRLSLDTGRQLIRYGLIFLGLLLGIDQDRKTDAINALRKRMYSTPEREFVYAVICEDRDGFANRLFRGLVRDYLGVDPTPNGKVKGVH